MAPLPGTFTLPGPSTLTYEYLLTLVSTITYNPPSRAPTVPKSVALALARAAAPEARSFDYTTHLGNLSPYFKPPVPHGVKETLPEDCKVEQVMLVRCASLF